MGEYRLTHRRKKQIVKWKREKGSKKGQRAPHGKFIKDGWRSAERRSVNDGVKNSSRVRTSEGEKAGKTLLAFPAEV